jgi:hypothetical protein
MNTKRAGMIIAGLVLIAAAGSLRTAVAQSGESERLPEGNWSLSAHPYQGHDHLQRPVVVSSVRTNKALTVDGVALWNISSKPVVSVQLSWRLTTKDEPEKTLQESRTNTIRLKQGVKPGESRFVKVQVVSFLEVHRPYLQKGRLEGGFRFEIAVSELLFEDESTWSLASNNTRLEKQVLQLGYPRERHEVTIRKVNSLMSLPAGINQGCQGFCAKQKCEYTAGHP